MVLTASNLASLTQSNYTLTSNAFGYKNSSGILELINHTSGEILDDSINVQFYCPTYVSGMITAEVCEPVIIESEGSGGGGGFSGGSSLSEVSDAQYDFCGEKNKSFSLR
jgi:hypothetical protein